MTGRRRTSSRLAGLAALLVAALAPSVASAEDYVAMGDSYSSGTGTRDYYDANCERSNFSYSKLIDSSIPGNLKLIACGGARTNNITGGGQHGNPGQGVDPALGAATEFVTISIGGNDAGFSDVLVECGQPSWISDCDALVDEAQRKIRDELPAKLNSSYDLIRTRAPNAAVTVVGYPRIFNGEDCNAATFFSGGEMTRLNQTADLLAETTRGRAQAHGFGFADARGAYVDHAVCDDADWINGLSNPVGESFHPNKDGHSVGYAGIVRAALQAQEGPTATRGPNGRIAFARGPGGGEDVYAINGNGSFPVNLTPGQAASDIDPAFSPDGTKIAFASNRDGDYEVYVANSDGTVPVKLTSNTTTEDREPAWSPNGEFIAFRSNRAGTNDIYRMTAAGGSQTQLTANAASEFAPAWSPDGAEIAYQRFDSQNDVWKMNSDGQGQTRLTADGGNDGAPEWSPSGSQIAFHSNRNGDFEIFTMTASGGSQTQRTANPATDERPTWSPSGASIAFNSNRDGDNEIFTMTSTGGSQTQRTSDAASDVGTSWQADGTAPVTTVSGPSGLVNTATPTFVLGSDEPGSTFECRVDSDAFSPCGSPHQTEPLDEGAHTFQARAIDPSANVDASPVQRSFTVDTTPAQTAITAGPSGPVRESAVTFEFGAEPGTTFTCRIDGVVVEDPCSSPYTTPSLPDGEHTFTVSGTDGVNVDEDSSSFTVDTVAPDTSLASGPGAATNEVRPSFELSAEAGSTFECRIDGGDFEGCLSPFSPDEDLSDGDHTFRARATDPAGNSEVDPLVVAFDVDTVAPAAAIDSGPPEATDPPAPPVATNDTTPTFEFSSPDGTSFECRLDSLDDSDWASCDSPLDTPVLEDGSHVFEIRAVDEAGNLGEAVGRRFIVDATAPETTFVGQPEEGAETKAQPAFNFEADDPDATFECRVDPPEPNDPEDLWEHCETGAPLTPGLGEGPHTLEVRAVDQVNNPDLSPAVRHFTVDLTPPGTTLQQVPPDLTNDPTPEFRFVDEAGGGGFECRVDADPFTACTSPHTTGQLDDGEHAFEVRALDPAGNEDPSPARDEFDLDTIAPDLTIEGPALTNDTTPTFTLGADEALKPPGFSCEVDSQPVACTDSLTTPELGAGGHTIEVSAEDPAGNPGTESKTFEIDLTAPNTAIVSGPVGTVADSTPTFTFDAAGSEPQPRFECSIDSGPFTPCSSPHTPGALPDGPHSFEVRTVDRAGNADSSAARRQFTIDTTPPRTTIDLGPREDTRERSPSFSFSSNDPSARFECRIDEGDFAPCRSPYVAGTLAYGAHTFAVRAVDPVDNREADPATRTFTVKPPDNSFAFGKPKRSPSRGTATLPVRLPGPGRLELSGDGLKGATKSVTREGTVVLKLVPTGAAVRELRRAGALKVEAKVRFTPTGGQSRTKSKRLKLLFG